MPDEPWQVGVFGAVAAALVALVYIAGSLQILPGGHIAQIPAADGTTVSGYEWGPFSFQDINNAGNWARYNFAGLEDPAKAYGSSRPWST